MAKAKTESFVLELELVVNPHELKVIQKKLNVGRQIYNACLGEALKCLHKVQSDPEYRSLLKEPTSRERNARLREIECKYGYSEYQLHTWVTDCKKHFSGHLGINEVQKLATRAFKAVEKVHYRKADRVHFKRKDELVSIENKSNKQGLRWKDDHVVWGELSLAVRVKKKDNYARAALEAKTKYIRIVPKVIRGKERFFVQFIQEGLPPAKERKVGPADSRVGIDPGTATMAIVSDTTVCLAELAPDAQKDEKKLRRIQRAMDRSRRATNPQNFNENGTIKKGPKKWYYSNRYHKLAIKQKELHRKAKAKRKQSHESLANKVIAMGLDVRTETMSYQGLQKRSKKTTRNVKNGKINKKKRFGKSLSNRAPAMFLTILERKLKYYGHCLKKAETFSIKASQFNHRTGEYTKKHLSDRWNLIDGKRVQRDLYSAFLLFCTNDSLNGIDLVQANNRYDQFLDLHNEEILRIKSSGNKTIKWYVA